MFIPYYYGCAVMSTSILETAETLEPGHIKIGLNVGNGLDLTTTSISNDTVRFTDNDRLFGLPTYGLKLGIGLSPGLEMNTKYWFSLGGVGSQIYVKKHIITLNENIKIAFLPGLAYVFSEVDTSDADELPAVKSYGVFLPIITHYKVNSNFLLYGSLRFSYDFVKLLYKDTNNYTDKSNIYRVGLITGFSLEFSRVYLRWEIGVEHVNNNYGFVGYLPMNNGSLGFKF